jgi:hypothetical protein
MPEEVLDDNRYFTNFNLSLPNKLPTQRNKFKGLNYSSLGDYKTPFDLRPIRNIIVKQNLPKDDDSSIYEIFNRLNSGGINLRPQEIRTSLYHSPFYEMLYRVNILEPTRTLLHMPEPDLHMKDVEILLRGFAMLMDSENYRPSMLTFLNQFSRKRRSASAEENDYLERLFVSFLASCETLPKDAFLNRRNRRFNIALFEAVFTASCERQYRAKSLLAGKLDPRKVKDLARDKEFLDASQKATTDKANVGIRLQRGRDIIGVLD